MNMSFKEKSTWFSLVVTLVIFGQYALNVASIDMQVLTEKQAIDAAMQYLSRAIIYVILLEILFQTLLAAANKQAAEIEGDERDKAIMLTSNNSGYWVLSIGVLITLGQLLIPHALGAGAGIKAYYPIPLFEIHLLIFVFIVSEIVRFAHQLYLYRKDAA